MSDSLFTREAKEGLERIRAGDSERVAPRLRYIDTNTGDPRSCKLSLGNSAAYEALHTCYNEGDLTGFRQWMYVAGKIQMHLLPEECFHGYPCLRLWKVLLSNHAGLREHLAWFPERYPLERSEHFPWVLKTRQLPCHANHQVWLHQLAMRGDWEALRREAGRALNEHPKSTKGYVLLDARYLLALANRDLPTMQECLAELLKPRIRKARNDLALLDELLSIDVLVLAKLAWLHGIEIDPQSDYVPCDWLPMTPNPEYVDSYDFMKTIELP